jgi:hypothetical protein
VQHTKTVTGYHGLYRDNDAIVMGCGALSMQRPAAFSMTNATCCATGYRSDVHPAPKWRVAMPATPWLASDGAGRQISKYK